MKRKTKTDRILDKVIDKFIVVFNTYAYHLPSCDTCWNVADGDCQCGFHKVSKIVNELKKRNTKG